MEKTRVAVTGLGGIAQIAHLPILVKMENVIITAVCDVDKPKAKSIAQKYNVKKFYSDYALMLKETEADCIIITSPTSLHREHSIMALEAGFNVLVEKPLARTFSEANDIVEAAKKSKKKLMVGMNNRFRPDIMMQESFISAKELGEIFYIKAGFLKRRSTVETWAVKKEESGGGVFMDLGIVLVDVVLWLMKFPKIKGITAVNYYHAFRTVEDSSFVMMRFVNNATVTL